MIIEVHFACGGTVETSLPFTGMTEDGRRYPYPVDTMYLRGLINNPRDLTKEIEYVIIKPQRIKDKKRRSEVRLDKLEGLWYNEGVRKNK